MRAHSALVVHPDARFRTELGRRTRRGEHAVYFAADAEEAKGLLAAKPGLRVAVVAPEAGGRELARELRQERHGLRVWVLGSAEASAPSGGDLARRLEDELSSLDRGRERRIAELASRRWRLRAARAAERLAAERLRRLRPSAVPAAVSEVAP